MLTIKKLLYIFYKSNKVERLSTWGVVETRHLNLSAPRQIFHFGAPSIKTWCGHVFINFSRVHTTFGRCIKLLASFPLIIKTYTYQFPTRNPLLEPCLIFGNCSIIIFQPIFIDHRRTQVKIEHPIGMIIT
jgi:hypothetical protein